MTYVENYFFFVQIPCFARAVIFVLKRNILFSAFVTYFKFHVYNSYSFFFRWVLFANHLEPVKGFLSRYLRRRLIEIECKKASRNPELRHIVEWIPKIQQHLNQFLETHASSDVTIGKISFLRILKLHICIVLCTLKEKFPNGFSKREFDCDHISEC